VRRLAALLLVVVAAAACGDDGEVEGDVTLTVFAASSLTEAFTEMGAAFEDAHPGTTVEFNFASSSDLADSIAGGDALGTADVFASADLANMAVVTDADAAATEPIVFVQNRAEIAVPVGNPGGVEGLEDFADEELLIGLCAEDVPCGTYAREVLANAGVEPSVDTNEAKVTDVVDKVISGDLDAGIVYASDVAGHEGDVEGIEIADEVNVLADYPIVAVAESGDEAMAEAFVGFVQSDEGRQVLEDAGFLIPA
jgi:molybdate transport system substrate-binding protein